MKKIDFTVTEENLENDIKTLYILLRPNINKEDISLSYFEEGKINAIVKCDDPKTNKPVVIRANGLKIKAVSQEEENKDEDKKNISDYQDSKLEIETLIRASELKISFKLLATYSNGIIYEYIEGKVLDPEKFGENELYKQSAIKMAKLHSIELNELENKKPFTDEFTDFELISEKIDLIKERMIETDEKKLKSLYSSFYELTSDQRNLFNLIKNNGVLGDACLCHNDLNSSNIIQDNDNNLWFIDFEWVNKNYQMYDIAVHLSSLSGIFLLNYNKDRIPKGDLAKNWLKTYYEEYHKNKNIKYSKELFDKFIENEYTKYLIMLTYTKLILFIRSLAFVFFIIYSKNNVNKTCLEYVLSIFNDLKESKDNVLELIKTLKSF